MVLRRQWNRKAHEVAMGDAILSSLEGEETSMDFL